MSITGIIMAAVIVGGTGLFIGIFLGLADKKLTVKVDEKSKTSPVLADIMQRFFCFWMSSRSVANT